MPKIKKLKSDNEHIYPVTVEKAIYDSNGNRLDNKLATFAKSSEVNTRFTSVENSIATISSDLGDAWNSSTTYKYKVGDYCIYQNALYKCKIEHSNVIPTNTTYWTRVKVSNELGTINRDLAEVTSVVVTSGDAGFVNKQVKYKVKNKMVILSGYFDVTAQLPNNGIIFNNLPAEVNDEVVMFTFGKMNSTNIYTGRMPVAGKVYLDSAIPVGTDYYVQASYFTK